MTYRFVRVHSLVLALLLIVSAACAAGAADPKTDPGMDKPDFGISEELGDAVSKQAAQVRKEIKKRTRSLFQREALGFSCQTVENLYEGAVDLPARIPGWIGVMAGHSRVLGTFGSLLILTFILALTLGLLGQKKLMARMQTRMTPLRQRIPESLYRLILPIVQVLIAGLFPLLLLGAWALIDALTPYEAAWFLLSGRLLLIWAAAATIMRLLRELLLHRLIRTTDQHARWLYHFTRWIVLYSVVMVAFYQSVEVFRLPADVLAFIRFVVSLSIVLVLFLLLLKKKSMLSLLPDLPHSSYVKFRRVLERYYFPLVFFCLLLAVLWTLGYRTLGRVLLVKIWSSGGAYLLIMVLYSAMVNMLARWQARIHPEDEAAQLFFRSARRGLMYGTALATGLIVLNLLGLLGLLEQTLSFPVLHIGKNFITLWVIVKAALIVAGFGFFSKLVQAYLDYRVYPAVGVEPGLGYALNTFLQYLLLAVGVLVALNVVGLDLRFVLVFAGALGIGIGLGLQSMAANVISGFSLIFGGKLRKGDWIEVSGTMGVVTDIYLRATKVRTRDNVEYIIPNANFINGILINYSLGSPLVRIDVPVGVSYDADPRRVEQILLAAASKEPSVSKEKPPVVRFVEFGESSLNFQLLVWIDVRTTPRLVVRSAIYFTLFEEFKKAGIEIPFPQRDLHIRSTVQGDMLQPAKGT